MATVFIKCIRPTRVAIIVAVLQLIQTIKDANKYYLETTMR